MATDKEQIKIEVSAEIKAEAAKRGITPEELIQQALQERLDDVKAAIEKSPHIKFIMRTRHCSAAQAVLIAMQEDDSNAADSARLALFRAGLLSQDEYEQKNK